ncbi:MAG: molybdenum cofactor biosynthesis protein MoaE [Capsulimonadales bacterium]|nr:molybdenum cofactor biosynthesis protein MoaE [Capsulimonadales bacterium]
MVLLTTEKLDPQRAIDAVMTEADGAYVLFVGVVRNHSRGRAVTGLEYQVYAPMAEKRMKRLVEEVRERWGLKSAILHRYGPIAVGEAAVVICVSSAHRAEAFDACRWTIDTLKEDVPIWKKEFAADGTFWIEGDTGIPAVASEIGHG